MKNPRGENRCFKNTFNSDTEIRHLNKTGAQSDNINILLHIYFVLFTFWPLNCTDTNWIGQLKQTAGCWRPTLNSQVKLVFFFSTTTQTDGSEGVNDGPLTADQIKHIDQVKNS